MGESAVVAEHISKRYWIGKTQNDSFRETISSTIRNVIGGKKISVAEFWALKDVSFQIEKGEAVGVIGRNGAGKSTILKVLSRITTPSSGRVVINGRVASLLEVGTGFHPELTGRENVFMNGSLLGMKKSEIKKKFDEIVGFSGVEKFIDTPVKYYSSGMYVRLAFAVAAHLEPEILIVDEVLAVGDAEFQRKCLGKMEEVGKHGRTIIFVSHNMTAVSTLCKKVLYLEHGEVAGYGETESMISRYLSKEGTTYEKRFELNNDLLKTEGVNVEWIKVLNPDDLEVDKEIQIQVKLSVNYKVTTETHINLSFNTETDTLIFVAVSPKKMLDIGECIFECVVPANLLNDNKYIVDMTVIRSAHAIFSEKGLLAFEVGERSDREGWMGKFPGTVRPELQWEIK
jgi:lipopolysaccharide transport system ATP-binding protein